jgi:hypothetical protein
MNGSSDMPAELMGPTPRSVRLSATGWVNLLVATLFIGLGVAGTTVIVKSVLHDAAEQDRLRDHGRETAAQVTDFWASRRRVSYSFSVDGTSFSGKSKVPSAIARNIHRGDSLPIRYLPEDPNINHAAEWKDAPYSNLWSLYLPAMPVFIGLMLVRRFPVQRQLAINGIAVRGCIAKTEWNGPSKGQRNANYTFRNASNDEVEIGSCPNDRIFMDDSTCWVLYLPTNPSRSEIYPFPIDFFRIDG